MEIPIYLFIFMLDLIKDHVFVQLQPAVVDELRARICQNITADMLKNVEGGDEYRTTAISMVFQEGLTLNTYNCVEFKHPINTFHLQLTTRFYILDLFLFYFKCPVKLQS